NVKTLNALLSDNGQKYNIPPYQRRYSWGVTQTKALLEDINNLQTDESHLFGMLIFHTPEVKHSTIEVVDGQQRITTLTILLKAIETILSEREGDQANYYRIRINSLLKINNITGGFDNKLTLGNLDNNTYEALINNKNLAFVDNIKLKNAYEFFYIELKQFTLANLITFIEKLLNKALFIEVNIGDVKDSYKVFETFNNRGLKLSATDLIKNLILGQAAKIDDGNYLEDVKDLWTGILRILDDLDNNNPDIFFRRYFCSVLRRPVSEKKLVDEFKKYYAHNILDDHISFDIETDQNDEEDDEDEPVATKPTAEELGKPTNRISIIRFLEEVKSAAIVYRNLSNNLDLNHSVRQEIIDLNKIKCTPTYIFLMQFLQFKDADGISAETKTWVIKSVATLMLRRYVCEVPTGKNIDIFSRAVHCIDLIKEGKIQEFQSAFTEHLLNYYDQDTPDAKFLDKLNALKLDKKENLSRAVLMLERYNYSINDKQIRFPDEHVMHFVVPKISKVSEFNHNQAWRTYLGNPDLKLIQEKTFKLGNATVVENEIEINTLAIDPFEQQRDSLHNSYLQLNRELAVIPTFNFAEIDYRTNNIAQVAVAYWRIDLNDAPIVGPGGGKLPDNPLNPVSPDKPIVSPPASSLATEVGSEQIENKESSKAIHTSLVLVPGTRENLETSIEKSVDIKFAIEHLGEEFVNYLLSKAGGIFCWAVTKNSLGFFEKLKENDDVLISEKRTNKFTHHGKVIAKTRSSSFGNSLWPISGENPWEYIYFLSNIKLTNISKNELLRDLGYDNADNLSGSRIVREENYNNLKRIKGVDYIARLVESEVI
ncbi:MAG: hypothetical protein RI995_1781, partial [Bacteroidota bacterium]